MKSNCRILCSQVTRCIRNLRFWKNANPNRSRSGASLKCVLAEYSRKEKAKSTRREASWCTSALTLPNRNSFRKFAPDERSECKPDRAQPSRDERSECKPDRAQPSRDERSECKPDRAQPSRNAGRSVENYSS